MENRAKREMDFQRYLLSRKVKKETQVRELVRGHMEKADHNLKFVKSALELREFNDWAIVSAYYSIYHASLALCALKGYSTKDHSATLLILIREFYRNGLEKYEIDTVGSTGVEKEDVLYYVETRRERKKASYSTRINFERSEAESVRHRAIKFVNRAKDIIETYRP